jgi:hypothetical protein
MPILGILASAKSGNLVPNAPTIGTATNTPSSRAYNNGAASVTFTPAGIGPTATSYTVTSSPGGYTASGASSPLVVTGLQSNTAYTFTVKANNALGSSIASSASNSITATTVPQAPTIGAANQVAGTVSATVAYTANATGGSAITVFTATSSPGSVTGTGSSPITVSGLTNSTSYTFTVTATNANGTSAASAASNNVVVIANPYLSSNPSLTAVGNVLTLTSGTWVNSPTTFVYKIATSSINLISGPYVYNSGSVSSSVTSINYTGSYGTTYYANVMGTNAFGSGTSGDQVLSI